MGGIWSGRHRFPIKMTVEECLTLNIEEFTGGDRLRPRTSSMQWYRGQEETACVNYSLRNIDSKGMQSAYILTLHSPIIHRGQRIPISQDIPLVTTELHSGGKRYWFSCPNCRERVGRLYLPMGEVIFFVGSVMILPI